MRRSPATAEQQAAPRATYLLVLAGENPAALEGATAGLLALIDREPDLDVAELAVALATSCAGGPHRRAVMAGDLAEAVSALTARDARRVFEGFCESGPPSVAFMFPGQGAQAPNMGLELYRAEPSFRRQVDFCCGVLEPLLGFDLRDVLFPGEPVPDEARRRLEQTAVAQPSLFVVEHALARLWMHWGVRPEAMLGNSLGEYVAACLAGVFSLEEALALVAKRGGLMQALPGGAMLNVAMPAEELAPLLEGDLHLAAVNGPSRCVVAGPHRAVEGLARRLAERQVTSRRLATSHAFHSAMMEPILGLFSAAVGGVERRPPRIPFITNLSGRWITASEAVDADHWVRHLRHTVRLADGLSELLRDANRLLLEIGPGQTLSQLARAHPERRAGQPVLASIADPQSERTSLLRAAARAWVAGVDIDWHAVYADADLRRRPAELRLEAGPAAGSALFRASPRAALEPVAPMTESESAICGIWSEVLGGGPLGRRDDFFDRGGDSLTAAQALSRLRAVLGVDVPLRLLLDAPVLADFAVAVELGRSAGAFASPLPRIELRCRRAEIQLSFGQQRLWLTARILGANAVYNVPTALRLLGPLRRAALVASLGEILNRHEVLRTGYREVDGNPVGTIFEPASSTLSVLDLSGLPRDHREAMARRLAKAQARLPFDLARGPILRSLLLRLGEGEHVLLSIVHHIAFDGWSKGVWARELAALYEAFSTGRASALPDLPFQYADFAAWQRLSQVAEATEPQLAYWRERLDGLPVLQLPSDRPRSPVQSFRGARHALRLPLGLTAAVKALARAEGATLSMPLLASFQALLSAYTRQDDIGVGSPIAGRRPSETEALIGFFVNTLVLRTDLSGDPTARELLRRAREVSLGAFAHQDVAFDALVEALHPQRDPSYNPLFQVMFALQNTPTVELALHGLDVEPLEVETGTAKADLILELRDGPEGLSGHLEHSTDLFDRVTVCRLAGHFTALLTGLVEGPERRLSELPLLTPSERQQALIEWNATAAEGHGEECVHHLVEPWAKLAPVALAVAGSRERLSYGELNLRANQLAHYLHKLGVAPDDRVGICLERSVELVVATLAVLKSGGAYVPLDPAYPVERLAFMAEDSGISVLLTHRGLAGDLRLARCQICLDTEWTIVSAESGDDPQGGAMPLNLAYVIYTSGSSGQPKGVAVQHASLARLVHWHRRSYDLTPRDRATLVAGPAFDASVWEIWPYLAAGASLHVPPREALGSGPGLIDWLSSRAITHCFLPTPLTELLLEEPWPASCRLRCLLTGGDTLHRWPPRDLPFGLFNHYGPTESTVVATWVPLTAGSASQDPPIGRPLDGVEVYLLDTHLRPVPVGVPGELTLGGTALARGYLNRPALTAERFVPDPFSVRAGARVYRTGDLARYRPDGSIEFLGRLDGQVKIRGMRVELGEIERVLSGHEAIREAAVVLVERGRGEKHLAAFLAARNGAEPAAAELRRFLKTKLPDHMVPSQLVFVAALPVTPNGKVDRRALRSLGPAQGDAGPAFVGPRNRTEEVLAGIWSELLGSGRAGVHDDFFAAGGHSLLASRLLARLRRAFGVELPLSVIFEAPTIEGLALVVEDAILQELEMLPGEIPKPLLEREA